MSDLPEALDAALRARYRLIEPKSPVTTYRGLKARVDQLKKELGTQAAVARAFGTTPRNLRRWMNEGVKPPPAALRRIEKAYAQGVTEPRLKASLAHRKPPTKCIITATIRWSNSPRTQYNGGSATAPGAHRTTELTGLRMGPVIQVWANHGAEPAAQAFERMCAEVHSAKEIRFEGNNVHIEFP